MKVTNAERQPRIVMPTTTPSTMGSQSKINLSFIILSSARKMLGFLFGIFLFICNYSISDHRHLGVDKKVSSIEVVRNGAERWIRWLCGLSPHSNSNV